MLFGSTFFMLKDIIKSSVMTDVLGQILFKDNLYLRDIARITKHSVSAVKKESNFLIKLNVIIPKKSGNTILFSQNRENILFDSLQKLFLNTDGFVYSLRQKLLDQADFVFAYGSFADKKYNNSSDIDLLIITKNKKEDLEKSFFDVQKNIIFPINPVIYNPQEFLKNKEINAFLKNVANGKKIWIIGDEIGFRRFVKSEINNAEESISEAKKLWEELKKKIK